MKTYSINHSRGILQTAFKLFSKKKNTLTAGDQQYFAKQLEALDSATTKKEHDLASQLAHEVEKLCKIHFKKTFLEYTGEIVFAIIVALVIATIVRQSWFELYEIPTGSMRPSFREQDHLTVTKTTFGINIPLVRDHLLFDPKLVQRGGVVTFTSEGISKIDEDTIFLGLFPYKKRLIKRLVGKPGDSLYFYGGKIYSVDVNGKLTEGLLDSWWFNDIEYIPFMKFAGDISYTSSEIIFSQMNQPIGRLKLAANGALVGEIFNGKEWIKDDPSAQQKPHKTLQTFSDFWGMKNYATARLLTRDEAVKFAEVNEASLPQAPLYLELRHSPSLTYPKPFLLKGQRVSVLLNPERSVLPLSQDHLDSLMKHMYTARFVVKNERARRYAAEGGYFDANSPQFEGVPDGTYEFYFGKAYSVEWAGVTTLLPDDHPLYKKTPENIQKLFNLGIEFNTAFSPTSVHQLFYPNRYAYFRRGDLYLLGAPIVQKDEPVLSSFLEQEEKKQRESTPERPYVAFKDYGPPMIGGKPDIEFIRTFGYTVPDRHYFVLGDNHAMSADSRVFGTVPEENLQGSPSLIIWPPGHRWGIPVQKPYPLINTPRLVVWGTVLMILLIWAVLHHRRIWKPIHLG